MGGDVSLAKEMRSASRNKEEIYLQSFQINVSTLESLMKNLQDRNHDIHAQVSAFVDRLEPNTVFDKDANDVHTHFVTEDNKKQAVTFSKVTSLSSAELLARVLPRVFSGELTIKSPKETKASKNSMDTSLTEFFIKLFCGCTEIPLKGSDEATEMALKLQNCIFVGSEEEMEPLLDQKDGLPIFRAPNDENNMKSLTADDKFSPPQFEMDTLGVEAVYHNHTKRWGLFYTISIPDLSSYSDICDPQNFRNVLPVNINILKFIVNATEILCLGDPISNLSPCFKAVLINQDHFKSMKKYDNPVNFFNASKRYFEKINFVEKKQSAENRELKQVKLQVLVDFANGLNERIWRTPIVEFKHQPTTNDGDDDDAAVSDDDAEKDDDDDDDEGNKKDEKERVIIHLAISNAKNENKCMYEEVMAGIYSRIDSPQGTDTSLKSILRDMADPISKLVLCTSSLVTVDVSASGALAITDDSVPVIGSANKKRKAYDSEGAAKKPKKPTINERLDEVVATQIEILRFLKSKFFEQEEMVEVQDESQDPQEEESQDPQEEESQDPMDLLSAMDEEEDGTLGEAKDNNDNNDGAGSDDGQVID
jgi:hypothetical protein